MASVLDSLRKSSVVVADTGDIDAVAKWRPQDTTTNPSLLLSAAQDPGVSTEVDARLSFDPEKSIEKAKRFISLYEAAGIRQILAMAVEKLADGIRRFDADARKLEAAVGALMQSARAAA
jgi:transaldolase